MPPPKIISEQFVRAIQVIRERIPDASRYPYTLPAVRALIEAEIALHPQVTFEHFQVTRSFLQHRQRMLDELLRD